MESALQHIVYIARDFSALLSCGINDILIVTSTEAKRSRPIDLILINLQNRNEKIKALRFFIQLY